VVADELVEALKETIDIEEHAGNMSGWKVRYDQISAG
jgi:AraC family ethanolamine operon transcriptional activator